MHGPVDSRRQAGYSKDILLVVAMLLWLTDIVESAGVGWSPQIS